MVQGSGNTWMRLTPDISGNYVEGTWSTLEPMSTARLYFASQVLPNGQVWVAGGEYSGPGEAANWSPSGEIYDPLSNRWSPIEAIPHGSNCPYISQFGGVIAKGFPTVTGMLTTTSFQAGWMVSGLDIPTGTTILSVDSETQITLSQSAKPASETNGVKLNFSVQSIGNTISNSTLITGIPSTTGFEIGWSVTGSGILRWSDD